MACRYLLSFEFWSSLPRLFESGLCQKMAVNFKYVMVTQAIRVTIWRFGRCKKREVDRGVLLSQNQTSPSPLPALILNNPPTLFWLVIAFLGIGDCTWIHSPIWSKTLVVKTKVSDVQIQMISYSENRCMQGSFLKRMHARVFFGTVARNQKGHFNGCTQQTFGQRMRARYGANPGCAQPTFRQSMGQIQVWGKFRMRATYMRATPWTPSLVLNKFAGIPAFCRNFDDFLGNSWEFVRNAKFVSRKGVCCRVHVWKWAARPQQLRNARWMQVDYCCISSVVLVYSCVCSLPSAFTSCRDTTSWLALISRYVPCNKHFFNKLFSNSISNRFPGITEKIKRLGFPQFPLVLGKDAARVRKQIQNWQEKE